MVFVVTPQTKHMKLTEFSELARAAQLNNLYRDGIYVGKRQIGNKTLALYQYESFYVEIHYSNYRKKIERILFSDDTEILDPYLDHIKITYRKS